MAMEYGLTIRRHKIIQAAIEWTKSKVLAFTNGWANNPTKDSLERITEKDLADYTS